MARTRVTSERRLNLLRSVSVAVAAAMLLTATGAFDTGSQPMPRRLSYWLVVMGIGSVWGQLCNHLVVRWPMIEGRPWLHVCVLTALVSLPMCTFVWAATGLFFHGSVYPLSNLPSVLVPVLVVTAAVCTLIVFLGRAVPVQTHASTNAAPPAKFMERVPLRLRSARLIAVQAEDHYLRVHTDLGSELVLMRLSDALGELEGLDGAQTHRSWWVAREAVSGATKGDGRATLTLNGGLIVPVSRRYSHTLREDGWY